MMVCTQGYAKLKVDPPFSYPSVSLAFCFPPIGPPFSNTGTLIFLDGTGSDMGSSVLPHYEESDLEKETLVEVTSGEAGTGQVRRNSSEAENVNISMTCEALALQNWG